MSLLENYWNNFFIYSARIALTLFFIPVVTAIIHRKYLNKPLRIFFIFCLATIIINLIEILFIWATSEFTDYLLPFLNYWEITNTFFIQIFIHLKNFILLSIFFGLIFPINNIRKHINFSGKFLAVIVLINYFFIEGYKEQGIINPSLNSIFIVILPLLYLWGSQRNSLRIPLKKNPYLWISIGLLIPNLLGLFLYFTGDFLSRNDFIIYIKLSIIKNLFEIIGQILIAIGFAHAYYARFIKINL